MFKIFALFAIVPATLLVAVSFFVLLAVRKTEKDQGLKVFGYVIAAFLWLSAAVVLATGVYHYARGCHMLKCMKAGMMHEGMGAMKMHGGMHPMMPQAEKDSK